MLCCYCQVEILCRCSRVWVDMDTLEKEAVDLASHILNCGLAQMPKDAYMIIIYSSFLIDVENRYWVGPRVQGWVGPKVQGCVGPQYFIKI